MSLLSSDGVVAIVPVKNGEASIADTVTALARCSSVDQILVVDDGSTDATRQCANETNVCVVLHLERNRGKGGAVAAAVAATPKASAYVLIDADLGDTASIAEDLALRLGDRALVSGGTDVSMVIGVPGAAAGRGGFGLVRDLARWGIRRGSGFRSTAPLSGQRAIDGPLLRAICQSPGLAERFGLETALTIDAIRSGASVVELPVSFEHRHTGRTMAGFRHRGAQGADIVRALWPRLTTPAERKALLAVFTAMALIVMIWSGTGWEPSSVTASSKADRVVVFAMSRIGLDDLGGGSTPRLDRLAEEGAIAATSVRTRSGRPSSVEGFASLGAGDRIRARDPAADTYSSTDPVGLGTAADAAALRTGVKPSGSIVVIGAAQTLRLNTKKFINSTPGALGDAVRAAGKRTASVGNSDTGLIETDSAAGRSRPASAAVMDVNGFVDDGSVSAELLMTDPAVPFGVRADPDRFVAAARRAINGAAVTILDPGDLDRVAAFQAETTEERAEQLRQDALRRTDAMLGAVVDALPTGTLLIVTAARPVTGAWELAPTVAWGAGVRRGYLHSPSTRRLGLVTITDLAPTILDALNIAVPDKMIGHALRYHEGSVSLNRLRSMNELAGYRERLYLPLTKGYVIFQAVLYILTIVLFSVRGSVGRAAGVLGWLMLAIAGLPLSTFVFRMIPHTWSLGAGGIPAILAIDALLATVARSRRRHPLSALSWILGSTVALIVVDLVTGARLQQSSVLGYSPHTAARFTGIGNAAFAALAACCILWASVHVAYAARPAEALRSAGVVCALVVIADGAPFLGSDVGGILTLVPVFALLLYSMGGRRLSMKVIGIAGAATIAILGIATGLDLLRPPESRTHLGRFVSSVGGANGGSTFETTVLRKLTTNIRVFTGSFWTWMVPIIAIVLLFFLVAQRGWERDMPRGSALRAGVVAALVAGLLGFSVNDSGTVVAALVFVFLGPFITLLALERTFSNTEEERLT